jgi:hypothetical protein
MASAVPLTGHEKIAVLQEMGRVFNLLQDSGLRTLFALRRRLQAEYAIALRRRFHSFENVNVIRVAKHIQQVARKIEQSVYRNTGRTAFPTLPQIFWKSSSGAFGRIHRLFYFKKTRQTSLKLWGDFALIKHTGSEISQGKVNSNFWRFSVPGQSSVWVVVSEKAILSGKNPFQNAPEKDET